MHNIHDFRTIQNFRRNLDTKAKINYLFWISASNLQRPIFFILQGFKEMIDIKSIKPSYVALRSDEKPIGQ